MPQTSPSRPGSRTRPPCRTRWPRASTRSRPSGWPPAAAWTEVPELFAAFMTTAGAAVEGREAITAAPSLPPARPPPARPSRPGASLDATHRHPGQPRGRCWTAASRRQRQQPRSPLIASPASEAADAARRIHQLMARGDDAPRSSVTSWPRRSGHVTAAVSIQDELPDDARSGVIRELDRLVTILARYVGDLPLAGEFAQPPDKVPAGETRAVLEARIALRRSAQVLHPAAGPLSERMPVMLIRRPGTWPAQRPAGRRPRPAAHPFLHRPVHRSPDPYLDLGESDLLPAGHRRPARRDRRPGRETRPLDDAAVPGIAARFGHARNGRADLPRLQQVAMDRRAQARKPHATSSHRPRRRASCSPPSRRTSRPRTARSPHRNRARPVRGRDHHGGPAAVRGPRVRPHRPLVPAGHLYLLVPSRSKYSAFGVRLAAAGPGESGYRP